MSLKRERGVTCKVSRPQARKRRKNSGAVVPHSIAIDSGPMGE